MGCAGSKGGAAKDTKKKGEEAPAAEAPAAEAAPAEAPVSKKIQKSSPSMRLNIGEKSVLVFGLQCVTCKLFTDRFNR